jgi:effector-binding domain-containing protein
MLDTPKITQTAAQPAAVIHVTVPREQIRDVMGPGITELRATLAAQGVQAAGPWFTHHARIDPAIFDFDIGVPILAPVAPTGRVVAGQLPATRVVRTVYQGPYEGLGDAWGELFAWIRTNGHAPGPDFWEVYLAGPESSSDPATYRTELNRPLIG